MRLHIAKEGDSIQSLSAKFGVATERILAANPQLGEAASLTRGMKVKIPTGPVYMTSAAEAAQAVPAPQAEPAATPVAPSAAENVAANVPAAGANDMPPLSGLSPTTPGYAPESFATEDYATKREESTPQPAVVAAAAAEASAVETLAAEL
ncbi:MAG TPA: LysM peptidoglycan-binding domain-containing protein, partial [Paenibacillus sp.]|nr:LysM peptidoglycan-binding domain-containing protein [Paenibacillus sp.]